MSRKCRFAVVCVVITLWITVGVWACTVWATGAAQADYHAIEIAGYTWSNTGPGEVLPPLLNN